MIYDISTCQLSVQNYIITHQASENRTVVFQSVPALIVALAIGSSFTQAFILGSGRPPAPAKFVSQILTGKFIEMSELIPENLASQRPNPPSLPLKVARLCLRLRRRARRPRLVIFWLGSNALTAIFLSLQRFTPKEFAIYSLIWP